MDTEITNDAATEPAEDAPRRKAPLIITAAAIVLAVAGTVTGIALATSTSSSPVASPTQSSVDTGDEDGASEEPLTSVAEPTEAPLSEDEEAEVERATAAAGAVVTALDEISQRGDGSAVGIESIATGWVLGELQSHAREQFDLGYTQTGDAVITSVTPLAVDLAAAPPTISLKVCVDVSGIDITDAAGNSLKDSLYNPGRPVAHFYGAVFEDNTWKISTHEIPDVQDCPAV